MRFDEKYKRGVEESAGIDLVVSPKIGVNKIRAVNNSRRPTSIKKEHHIFPPAGMVV